MIILHAYSDKRPDNQTETIQALKEIEQHYKVVHIKMRESNSYDYALYFMLSLNEDFMIIEQDIVPTLQIIQEIEKCPELICVARYNLYPVSTLLQTPVYAHRIVIGDDKYRWVDDNDKYADLYGFGLVRFRKEVIPLLKEYFDKNGFKEWINLDTRISLWTYQHNLKAHLHGFVKHNHDLIR